MKYYEDVELNQVKITPPYHVSKEEIIEFATQWDPQPFHTSEEEAAKWPLGLSASSIHTFAMANASMTRLRSEPVAAIAGLGWGDVRMPHPVRPDDTLTTHAYLESKRESKSKPDLGIITTRVKVFNQNDVLVMTYTNTSMIMKRPVD